MDDRTLPRIGTAFHQTLIWVCPFINQLGQTHTDLWSTRQEGKRLGANGMRVHTLLFPSRRKNQWLDWRKPTPIWEVRTAWQDVGRPDAQTQVAARSKALLWDYLPKFGCRFLLSEWIFLQYFVWHILFVILCVFVGTFHLEGSEALLSLQIFSKDLKRPSCIHDGQPKNKNVSRWCQRSINQAAFVHQPFAMVAHGC